MIWCACRPSRACPGWPAVTKTGEISNVTSGENCSATHTQPLDWLGLLLRTGPSPLAVRAAWADLAAGRRPLHRRRLQRRWWRGLRWRQRRRIRWLRRWGVPAGAAGNSFFSAPAGGGGGGGGASYGGGGGSFDDGLNQILAAGVQAGDGEVMITELAPAVPEPSTWAMSLAGFAALAFAGLRRARSRAASA